MIFGIYSPPDGSQGQGWSDLKLGDICDAVDFDYTKFFCGVGTFTLTVPRNSVFAEKIFVGCFFIRKNNTDEYEGFTVQNIVYDNDLLKITGYDLNGLLLDRVTLYSEENTNAAKKTGSTEEIVKYYVDSNCVSSSDEERNFPALGIAENQDRGIANDAASPRLECVADVVADILGAQNMGYKITPLLNVTGGAIMEFEVYEAVNRTQDQNENNRAVFSFGLKNITEMNREVGVTADKNAFYCEIASGAVQRYYKKEEREETELDDDLQAEPNLKSGYDRREEYLKLNCELGEVEVYAEHEIADRFRRTDSLTIIAGNPLDYGIVYNVGDIVTVYDRDRKLQLDSIISSVEERHSSTEFSVKITLGDSKPKLLDSYSKKGQATAVSVRASPVSFNIGSMTKYEYISDTSVKLNNVTYTAEKNEDGLILKITDSNGNELKPTISGVITDTALHNAVFWAAAISRGIYSKAAPEVEFMPHMDGIFGYFTPESYDPSYFTWKNLIEGKGNFVFDQGTASAGNNCVRLSSFGIGTYANAPNPVTVYIIFKTDQVPQGYGCAISKEYAYPACKGYGIYIGTGNGDPAYFSEINQRAIPLSSTPVSEYQVYVLTYDNSLSTLIGFGNGVQAQGYVAGTSFSDGYRGSIYLNRQKFLFYTSREYDNAYKLDIDYKMIAIGSKIHTQEQVLENSQWLLNKYLGGQ